MRLADVIRKVDIALADGAIDSYRIVRDREGYAKIYVKYDGEESMYFDEHDWL